MKEQEWVKYRMYIYKEGENRCYLVEDEYDRLTTLCEKVKLQLERLKKGERLVVEMY